MKIGYVYGVKNTSLPNKIYIGSTQKPINHRLMKHKWNYNAFKKNQYPYYSVFDLLQDNNYFIELLDEIEFDEIYELENLEYEYMKKYQNECINKKVNKQKNKIICCPNCQSKIQIK